MRFHLPIFYIAFAVATLTAVRSDGDAGIAAVQARDTDVTQPFHARQSSLMGAGGVAGHVRMHRRAKGCRAAAASNVQATKQKDSETKKKNKKHSSDDKKDKKKKHKHHDDKKHEKKKSTKSSSKKAGDQPSGKDIVGKAKGLIGLTFSGNCRNPDASDKYPNGNINFLNCGISKSNPNSAWTPPDVKMSQLKFISSDQAAKSGVFHACSKYKTAFDSAADQTGVPAVLLMAFAMQESSCNPSVTGGNGEMGMMQLTPDKCHGQNCYNANTNIAIAARYFAGQLKAMGGNALLALGSYNGWQKGLTFNRATSQQYGCFAQNNLDYLNQMLNGWVQGKDGHSMKVYNNLAKCG